MWIANLLLPACGVKAELVLKVTLHQQATALPLVVVVAAVVVIVVVLVAVVVALVMAMIQK